MRRSSLAVTVLLLALVCSATSLGASGYRLYAAATSHPPKGSVFTVSAHGFAATNVLVYYFLDRKACRSTWKSEAKRVNARTFKAGESYFRATRKPYTTLRTHGQFYKSYSAYAGTKTGREHVCVYMTTRSSHARRQLAAAKASYTVTS